MAVLLLWVVLILEGINLAFTTFMGNLLLGILLIVVGVVGLLENRGILHR